MLIAVMGASAQAGAPIFTHAGPLACGLRLYVPGQVQEWCFYSTPPAPPKIICNAIHVIAPAIAGDTPPVAASQSCFATTIDFVAYAAGVTPNGTINQVTWLVWQPIVALPPNSTGTIQYQIASSIMPCAVNPHGSCVPNSAPLPPATLQEGSFSSGVTAAGLLRYDVDGGPLTLVDVMPQAQWSASFAPGLAVLSTAQLAHAITPAGLCTVTASEPGTAQFGIAGGKLKVGWLRDGWCPGGPGAQPTIQGACSPLALTQTVGIDPDGKLRCTAMPDEPTVALVEAILSWWSAGPTMQGR